MNFELPWPPSVNTYWRNTVVNGKPRTLLSARGRNYRKQVGQACLAQGVAGKRLEGRLAVQITLQAPDRGKRDIDNAPKGILDGLTHAGVWLDDEQVDELTVIRGPVAGKPGRVVVRVSEL